MNAAVTMVGLIRQVGFGDNKSYVLHPVVKSQNSGTPEMMFPFFPLESLEAGVTVPIYGFLWFPMVCYGSYGFCGFHGFYGFHVLYEFDVEWCSTPG